MTFQLTVLYHHPEDTVAFDEHYESTHAPLASKIPGAAALLGLTPGVRSGRQRAGGVPGGDPAVRRRRAFGAAMRTEEGKAAVADVGTFATGGVTMLTGDVTTYA